MDWSLRHVMRQMYEYNLTVIWSYRLISKNRIVYNPFLFKSVLGLLLSIILIFWSEDSHSYFSRLYIFKDEWTSDKKLCFLLFLIFLLFILVLNGKHRHVTTEKSAITVQALENIWAQSEFKLLFVLRTEPLNLWRS